MLRLRKCTNRNVCKQYRHARLRLTHRTRVQHFDRLSGRPYQICWLTSTLVSIGWLVQQRLPGLRQLQPVAWTPGLLWLGAGAFAWLLGAAAGVALFRHGALVVMLQGATIALLGPAVARALLSKLHCAAPATRDCHACGMAEAELRPKFSLCLSRRTMRA